MLIRRDLIVHKAMLEEEGMQDTDMYEVVCLAIQLWDAAEKAKEVLTTWLCARTPQGKQAKREALAAIEKAIGGKAIGGGEDAKSMGNCKAGKRAG